MNFFQRTFSGLADALVGDPALSSRAGQRLPYELSTLHSPAPGFEIILTASTQRRQGLSIPVLAGGKA